MVTYEIAERLTQLSKPIQLRFIEMFDRQVKSFEKGVFLRGPYRLTIDSNILMRLEEYNKNPSSPNLLLALLFINLIKSLSLKFDIIVRPSVFYEFARKEPLENTRFHWEKIKALRKILKESVDLQIFFEGTETYEMAEYLYNQIEKDANRITAELQSYPERIPLDLIRELEKYPVTQHARQQIQINLAAIRLHKPIELDYFSPAGIQYIFIAHIQNHLAKRCSKSTRIQKGPVPPSCLHKILTLTNNGTLKGLADADIFSICNITRQSQEQACDRYHPASIAFTVDKDLHEALAEYSAPYIPSERIQGGSANLDDSKAKLEAFLFECNRLNEGNERRNQIALEILNFYKELDDIFTKLGVGT